MFFLPLLALLGGVRAQNATASATDIAVVEANFQNAQLVPELIDTFSPEGVLSFSFGGTDETIGSALDQTTVSSSPSLTVAAGSSASDISATNNYTVMMVDADIVGTDESSTNQTRHWLVNGAKLTEGDSGWSVTWDGSTSVTDYTGPGPAEGSGPHRYVLIIYNQPTDFSPPSDLTAAGVGLGTFSFSSYVSSSNLGPLIAATYFTVENGQATVSVASTTAVDTATVSAASTTASGASASGSGSASGSATKSGSASGTATSGATSASASSTGGALRETVGLGAIVGAVGIVGAIVGAGLGF